MIIVKLTTTCPSPGVLLIHDAVAHDQHATWLELISTQGQEEVEVLSSLGCESSQLLRQCLQCRRNTTAVCMLTAFAGQG